MPDTDTAPDPFAAALANLRLAASQAPPEAHARILVCAMALWDNYHALERELHLLKNETATFTGQTLQQAS